jgi:adenylate kinase
MDFINIIIFGAPGCGKGTQSILLQEQYKLYHLSTGDLLREIKQDPSSPFYSVIQEKMAKGELVNDEILYGIVSVKIKNIMKEEKYKGIIFDGFPRTIEQAEFLKRELESNNISNSRIFLLSAAEEIVIDRILNRFTCTNCGAVYNKVSKLPKIKDTCDSCSLKNVFSARVDDTPEVIKNRLKVFNENMEKIQSYYGREMVTIDASLESKEVFINIKKTLEK